MYIDMTEQAYEWQRNNKIGDTKVLEDILNSV